MDNIHLFVESPLWQFSVLVGLITAALLFTRMSGQKLLEFGVNLLFIWLLLILLGSWVSAAYWTFLGKGLLAFAVLFGCWFALLKICDRYGEPCLRDGTLAMLLPVFIIPHMMVLSLIGRGLKALFW